MQACDPFGQPAEHYKSWTLLAKVKHKSIDIASKYHTNDCFDKLLKNMTLYQNLFFNFILLLQDNF